MFQKYQGLHNKHVFQKKKDVYEEKVLKFTFQ